MREFVEAGWYGSDWRWWLLWPLLAPLSLVFILLAELARKRALGTQKPLSKPVLVVGNITVGGTGKTPVMVSLVRELKIRGFRPAIVSRGYGAKPPVAPFLVAADTGVAQAGDEPLMLVQATGVPVVIDPMRARAAAWLDERDDCDVILSDDGLQHYGLWRWLEICVLDASRGLGNGWRLPFGPLRESAARLESVDWVLINGQKNCHRAAQATCFDIVPGALVNLLTGERQPLSHLRSDHWLAICGIGNPARFFTTLSELGCDFQHRIFADHHPFCAQDFSSVAHGQPIVMTHKDAVKCRSFARANWWYLAVDAALSKDFVDAVAARLRDFSPPSHTGNH